MLRVTEPLPEPLPESLAEAEPEGEPEAEEEPVSAREYMVEPLKWGVPTVLGDTVEQILSRSCLLYTLAHQMYSGRQAP
jgi:hypothetical protein